MFERAICEPVRLLDVYVSKHSMKYQSVEQEVKFMQELKEKSHELLCKYSVYKIY